MEKIAIEFTRNELMSIFARLDEETNIGDGGGMNSLAKADDIMRTIARALSGNDVEAAAKKNKFCLPYQVYLDWTLANPSDESTLDALGAMCFGAPRREQTRTIAVRCAELAIEIGGIEGLTRLRYAMGVLSDNGMGGKALEFKDIGLDMIKAHGWANSADEHERDEAKLFMDDAATIIKEVSARI